MCILRDESAESGMATLLEAVKFREMITGVGRIDINHHFGVLAALALDSRRRAPALRHDSRHV